MLGGEWLSLTSLQPMFSLLVRMTMPSRPEPDPCICSSVSQASSGTDRPVLRAAASVSVCSKLYKQLCVHSHYWKSQIPNRHHGYQVAQRMTGNLAVCDKGTVITSQVLFKEACCETLASQQLMQREKNAGSRRCWCWALGAGGLICV